LVNDDAAKSVIVGDGFWSPVQLVKTNKERKRGSHFIAVMWKIKESFSQRLLYYSRLVVDPQGQVIAARRAAIDRAVVRGNDGVLTVLREKLLEDHGIGRFVRIIV